MTTFIDNLRKSQKLLYAFVLTWLIPIATNVASNILTVLYGETAADQIQLLSLFLALVIGLIALAFLSLPPKQHILSTDDDIRPPRFPGLIVTVGVQGTRNVDPSKLSHINAIEYHLNNEQAQGERLRVCWLLASEDAISNANEVKKQYEGRCKMIIKRLDSAFRIQDTYNVVQQIYATEAAANKLSPEKVLADLTGGTKPISIGMALATQNRYPVQYVYGGKPDIKSEPILPHFEPKVDQ
jgi:hypothetical protein